MPTIKVSMFEGRTEEQKAEISKVFTNELSRILKGDHGQIKVEFNDMPKPVKSE